MRENRLSGSEGGGSLIGSPYPYQSREPLSHTISLLLMVWKQR
jgi:hypothetical protein